MKEPGKQSFKGKEYRKAQLVAVCVVLAAGLASNYVLDGVLFRWPW